MKHSIHHISDARLQWMIDGLYVKAWDFGPKANDSFINALLELKQRRAEDRQNDR